MHTGFVQRGLPHSSPKNAAAPLYYLALASRSTKPVARTRCWRLTGLSVFTNPNRKPVIFYRVAPSTRRNSALSAAMVPYSLAQRAPSEAIRVLRFYSGIFLCGGRPVGCGRQRRLARARGDSARASGFVAPLKGNIFEVHERSSSSMPREK